jgi:hypothetical protein
MEDQFQEVQVVLPKINIPHWSSVQQSVWKSHCMAFKLKVQMHFFIVAYIIIIIIAAISGTVAFGVKFALHK